MLPEDVMDLIIAFVLLVLLGSVVWALQTPFGKALGGGVLTNEAKITTEKYNFEDNIFLLNYLKTPVERDDAEFMIADYVFMCEDKFDDLREETKNIFKDYNKEVNIVILCDGERKTLCGDDMENMVGLDLIEGYGIYVKLNEISEYYTPYGPQQTGGCI